MNTVIIGIGSNIHPEENIIEALKLLGESFKVLQVSTMVRTSPIGITDQPDFLNGAVKIITELDASSLQTILKKIEDKLGRDRSLPKFGPRTMDLDVVVWNGEIVDQDYYSRPFLQRSVKELTG